MNIFKGIAFMLFINCGVIAQVKNTKSKGSAAMYLAFDIATKERFVFPIQFFKLNKVKKILASNIKDPDNDFVLEFNHKGQWTGLGTKGDNLSVKYKNDMPAGFTNNHGRMLDFYYSGDTAVVKAETRTWQYALVGNMFLDKKSYPYETIIYSSTQTEMNRNKGKVDTGNVERAGSFYDKAGNLVMNITENGFTTNRVFKMKNGLPVSMTTRWIGREMKGIPEAKPEITRFSYTYFQ